MQEVGTFFLHTYQEAVFSQAHVCIDNFKHVCGQHVHILQLHELEGNQAPLVLAKTEGKDFSLGSHDSVSSQ